MNLGHYLSLISRSQHELAEAFREVAAGHAADAAVFHISGQLAAQCEERQAAQRPTAAAAPAVSAAAVGEAIPAGSPEPQRKGGLFGALKRKIRAG